MSCIASGYWLLFVSYSRRATVVFVFISYTRSVIRNDPWMNETCHLHIAFSLKYGLSEYGLDKSKLNKFKKLKSWLVFYSLPSSTEYDPGRTHKIYCSVRSYKIKRVNKNPMPSFFPSKLQRRPKSRYRFSLGNIPRLLVPRLSTLSWIHLSLAGKSIPVHSLILPSRLYFCVPLLLFIFTVPCRIVFA